MPFDRSAFNMPPPGLLRLKPPQWDWFWLQVLRELQTSCRIEGESRKEISRADIFHLDWSRASGWLTTAIKVSYGRTEIRTLYARGRKRFAATWKNYHGDGKEEIKWRLYERVERPRATPMPTMVFFGARR